ncbi:MAG: hypothetical protein ABSF98_23100 [Bryobacteraceae bacterium]|jgi:hypothetical protein
MRKTTFAISLCCVAVIASADEHFKPTSANVFGIYASLVSDAPLTKAELETYKWGLEWSGGAWRMSDLSGVVTLEALPDGSLFSLHYIPREPSALNDSVLAALISKAEGVEFDNADEIVITLPSRDLSHDQRKGIRKDRLKVNLHGGLWQETDVAVIWKIWK